MQSSRNETNSCHARAAAVQVARGSPVRWEKHRLVALERILAFRVDSRSRRGREERAQDHRTLVVANEGPASGDRLSKIKKSAVSPCE
jgi:hypothetical protein